jgi:hypothetical protein
MEELANVNWDEKKQRLVDLLEPIAVAYLYVIAVMFKQCVLEKNKRVGKICVIISIVMFGIFVLCIVLYILLYAFIFAAILGSGGNFS